MQSLNTPSPPTKLQRTEIDPAQRDADSTSPATPPIYKLHDDILFQIFTINSLIHHIPSNKEDPANHPGFNYTEDTLLTTHTSSQICSRWRTLLLSSPTIWANALDISYCNQRTNNWCSEVLKRTQNAPLSIISIFDGHGYRHGAAIASFIFTLLRHHWTRIRLFVLSTSEPNVLFQTQLALQRPAPNLEHIRLHRVSVRTRWSAPPSRGQPLSPLFADYSPRLTFFRLEWIRYTLDGVWMSNIRHLWLGGRRAPFTVPEIYQGLHNLPLLEELCITYKWLSYEEEDDEDDDNHAVCRLLQKALPTISLPHLSDITIMTPHTEFITHLLRYIAPSPKCRLIVGKIRLSSTAASTALTELTLLTLSKVYATFLHSADLISTPTPYMSLIHTTHIGEGFALRFAPEPLPPKEDANLYMTAEYAPSLYIACAFDSDLDTERLRVDVDALGMPILQVLLSRPDFHIIAAGITQLQLRLNASVDARGPPSDLRVLLDLLHRLENVTELHCDPNALRFLSEGGVQARPDLSVSGITIAPYPSSTTPILFPKLTSLVLERFINPSIANCHNLKIFLSLRQAIGAPIQLLDLRMPQPEYQLRGNDGRWNFLKGMKGLSVSWTDLDWEIDYEWEDGCGGWGEDDGEEEEEEEEEEE